MERACSYANRYGARRVDEGVVRGLNVNRSTPCYKALKEDPLPRDHHYLFAHVLLRNQFFGSPTRVIEELSGAMRDAFLMYLWEEVGKVADEVVSPVGHSGGAVRSLEVLGTDERDGWLWLVVQLPPAEQLGEAHWVVLLVKGGETRYFTITRSVDAETATLAEYKGEQRVSFGGGPVDVDAQLERIASLL